MKQALLAHPGTQHSFRLAAELHRRRRLAGFHTGLAFAEGGAAAWLANRMPAPVARRLRNRRLPGVPPSRVRLHPWNELQMLWRRRAEGDTEALFHHRNERFQQQIPIRDLEAAGVVIGFDTSAWILMGRCREAGTPCLLVQTTGHPDSKAPILERIRADYPDWGVEIEARLPALRAAEQIEHERAARIVASSSFTRRTLLDNGVPAEKIVLNPHGVDARQFARGDDRTGDRALRFVFAGAVNAPKGVPLLLEAWRRLRPRRAELWLVGPLAPHRRALIPEGVGIRVLGPVPHSELPALLQQCDVFVFPSYFEGFGKVILEAMACGLPVVTTSATAGPDLFANGDAGWIIEPGRVDELASVLEENLSHPRRLRALGDTARQIALGRTWHAYGDRWLDIIEGR